MEPILIIHGGAGVISEARKKGKIVGMKKAVLRGFSVLKETDNPMDAVEMAVRVMEDDDEFNTGYGSVLTRDGQVEMDAMIIRGSDLATGGVGAVKHIANPISLARAVMEKSEHALIVGTGAEKFALANGFELVDNSKLVAPRALALLKSVLSGNADASTETGETPPTKESDEVSDGVGTVGAVAINSKGELAAATSTGGIAAKLTGRVGDTPICGGGTFCDDEVCGISATGLGEAIMRSCLCSRIANLIEKGIDSSEACLSALNYMTLKIPEGDGGAIVLTKNGQIGFNFNSRRMAWAYIKGSSLHYGVDKGEDIVEELGLTQQI